MSKDTTFCHLHGNLVINMVKKLKDTVTKTEMDAAKNSSKRVVQKTAEATGDLVGNKIADKITFIGKSKEKGKTKKVKEIYIPPEKDNEILMTLNCFVHKTDKNGISKNCRLA